MQFVLWRSVSSSEGMFKLINKKFKIITVKEPKPLNKWENTANFPALLKSICINGLNQATRGGEASYAKYEAEENVLWDLSLPEQPTQWVAQAGHSAKKSPYGGFGDWPSFQNTNAKRRF